MKACFLQCDSANLPILQSDSAKFSLSPLLFTRKGLSCRKAVDVKGAGTAIFTLLLFIAYVQTLHSTTKESQGRSAQPSQCQIKSAGRLCYLLLLASFVSPCLLKCESLVYLCSTLWILLLSVPVLDLFGSGLKLNPLLWFHEGSQKSFIL